MAFDPIKLARFGVEYETSTGKKVVLMWTHFAMSQAEKAGLGSPQSGTFTNQLLTVWALLLYRQPTITLEEVGDFIDAERAAGKEVALDQACIEAMRKAKVLKEPPQQDQDPQTPAPTTTD